MESFGVKNWQKAMKYAYFLFESNTNYTLCFAIYLLYYTNEEDQMRDGEMKGIMLVVFIVLHSRQ